MKKNEPGIEALESIRKLVRAPQGLFGIQRRLVQTLGNPEIERNGGERRTESK